MGGNLDWRLILEKLFGKPPQRNIELERELWGRSEVLSTLKDMQTINEAKKVKQIDEDSEFRKRIDARDKAIEDFLDRNDSFDFYGTTVFACYHWYGQICGMYKLKNGQITPITIGEREALKLIERERTK